MISIVYATLTKLMLYFIYLNNPTETVIDVDNNYIILTEFNYTYAHNV